MSPCKRDVAVRYEKGGKLLALATIFRDEESLREEIAMEEATHVIPSEVAESLGLDG